MCEKCGELDRQLDHYAQLAGDADPFTAAAAEVVLADLREQLLALHPKVANDI